MIMKLSMNQSILALVLGFLVVVPAFGQVEEAVLSFDEGNQLYRDGQYKGAIDAYERARSLGFTSGILNYNLGNAYYRDDQLGQAIRFYEKARIYMPDNAELNHNLSLAQSEVRSQFSQLPLPVWIMWWRSLVAQNGARTLFFFGFFVYLIAIGLFAHYIRTRTKNPWYRRARAAAVVLSVIFIGTAFLASVQAEQHDRAVVVVDEVQLRNGPSQEGEQLTSVYEGVLVDLVQQQDDWVEVRLPNGMRGWILISALAEV